MPINNTPRPGVRRTPAPKPRTVAKKTASASNFAKGTAKNRELMKKNSGLMKKGAPVNGASAAKPKRGYTQVELNKSKSLKSQNKVYNSRRALSMQFTTRYPEGIPGTEGKAAKLHQSYLDAYKNSEKAHAAYMRAVNKNSNTKMKKK